MLGGNLLRTLPRRVVGFLNPENAKSVMDNRDGMDPRYASLEPSSATKASESRSRHTRFSPLAEAFAYVLLRMSAETLCELIAKVNLSNRRLQQGLNG